MVNMNKIMKKMLLEDEKDNEISKIDLITEEVVSKTKLIRDCIIFDEDGMLDESEINFSRILKFDKDWTGYEVSCNELRFHTYRKDEGLWLDKDLNKYDNPILYRV